MNVTSPPANFAVPESGGPCSSQLNRKDEIVAEVALSPGQKALWFLQQLAPESPAYHVFRAVEIQSELDIDAFHATLQQIMDRHPALRTTFTTRNGEPIQQIHQSMAIDFKVEDASAWSKEDLNQRLNTEALRPFDLERGPLIRVSLFSRSTSDHVVLFNFHHSITDLWSLAIMMNELGAIYDTKLSNKISILSPIEMQYADYVRAQADMLAGPEGERMWQYWKEKLAGELAVLSLPVDRPRPPVQTYLGASRALRLGEDLVQGLKVVARANKTTLFSTLIAAFQILLHRYSNQEDIVIGTPKSGRSRKSMATFGYFVNPVPLRVNCSGNMSFAVFLKQVHQTVQEAGANDEYPFALLVEQLKPIRDVSRSPIFQVFFTMQKTMRMADSDGLAYFAIGEGGGRMHWGSIPVLSKSLEKQIAPFDLTMLVAETSNDFLVSLQYNVDLFNADTIQRMLGHYQMLLTSIVADPEEKISRLMILPEDERRQLLEKWNDTKSMFPENKCLHHLFEDQVKKNPGAFALLFKSEQLTYSELNHRANQLAHYLRRRGVTSETIVGITIERSLEMIIGLLGVLKAGGAYLPLDPTYPGERLKFMVTDSEVRLLLTQQKLVEKFLDYNIETVCLDTDWWIIEQERRENPSSHITPENLAYVIYTSGSTGKPKGTMVSHRGLCNLVAVLRRTFAIDHSHRILQFSSLSFDASVWETVMAFAHGATLVLTRQQQLLSAPGLLEVLKNNAITTATLPPSVLAVIPETNLPDLKIIITAGEQCSAELAARWSIGRRFFNAYGPTETTICASIMEVKAPSNHPPAIGRPIDNFRLYILDNDLQPVPIGVVGELYIGGIGLARGYFHQPELTAEKFIPDPFSIVSGQRMYRSGDLVRYLPDGNIDFLGRADHQVKVRGFRIELEEIEAVLNTHPAVKQCAVIAKKDHAGEPRLIAYIAHDDKAMPNSVDLRNFLKLKMPEFMLPSAFVMVALLPLTPNGKIDRQALPEPDEIRTELDVAYVKPQTQVEVLLANIWQEVLDLDKVGIHDNFFDLGGHSLAIIKVQNKLSEILNREISVVDFFKYPTIHSFAKFLSHDQVSPKTYVEKRQRVSKQREILNVQRQQLMSRRKSV